MPKFIKLTPYNEKIKDFYVCVDKIAYFASAAGYEGTAISFIDGKMERVKELPETIKGLMERT